MEWVKRNLGLVIGGAVALAFLGFAGYFLYTKMSADREITESVNQSTEQLKSLVNRDPHPGNERVDNISAAKEEEGKLESFVQEVRGFFQPATSQQLTSRELGALLDNTINELQSDAEKAGVEVPKDYWFTFSAQKSAMTFPADAIEPLGGRLADIKAICDVLFDSKVSALVGIRRVAVSGENTFGSQDYLTNKLVTNAWAIVAPYEVTFKSFTPELANVLEGFVKSKEAIIVKSLAVRPASQAAQAEMQSPYMTSMPYSNPAMLNRYGGLGMGGSASRYGGSRMDLSRYGLRPTPPPQPPPQAGQPGTRSTGILVEPKPLSITLSVEVVRLIPPASKQKT